MQNVIAGIFLSLFSASVVADHIYTCTNAEGASMKFIYTTLFGEGFEYDFDYRDGKNYQFGALRPRVREDGEYYILSGRAGEHSHYVSFIAEIPIIYMPSDNIPASLRFKDASGRTVHEADFQCSFKWIVPDRDDGDDEEEEDN